MTIQFIADTQSTPEAAQKASDEAHDGWRSGMDRYCQRCLSDFLSTPDTHTRDRLVIATSTLLKSVEARRRYETREKKGA